MLSEESSEDRIARTGTHGPYRWLTVTGDVYMGDVVRLLPDAVLNRYLAVTSYDSGIRRLSPEEISAGWVLRDDIAYSPRIETIDGLKFQRDNSEAPGYDEWYVFANRPSALGRIYHGNYFKFLPGTGDFMVFVNSPAFVLHDPEPYMPGILNLFWQQLLQAQPETFIADGQDCVTIISRRGELIETAAARLLSDGTS